jgi:hypothetical protein
MTAYHRVDVEEELADMGALERLMRDERLRLKRIQQLAAEQTGAIREAAKRASRRKQAKRARKRNR